MLLALPCLHNSDYNSINNVLPLLLDCNIVSFLNFSLFSRLPLGDLGRHEVHSDIGIGELLIHADLLSGREYWLGYLLVQDFLLRVA